MKKLSDPNLYSSRFLSLANLNIYSLRDMSRLIHIQYLDLSDNRLIKLGTTFSPLISLQCLLLDNNHIHLFDKSLDLPNLKILSLKNNGKYNAMIYINLIIKYSFRNEKIRNNQRHC